MAGIFANYAINGLNPSIAGGAGTGLLYFPAPPALNLWNVGQPGVNAGVTSNQQGGTPSSTNYTGQLSVPGNSVFNGQRFSVVVSGNVFFGAGEASTTATIKINANVGTIAVPSIVDLLGTSVQFTEAGGASYYPFSVAMTFAGDTLSGIVAVSYQAFVNGALTAPTHIAALTGINFAGVGAGSAAVPPVGVNAGLNNYAFGLACGVQFGASNTANSANLYQFQLYAE